MSGHSKWATTKRKKEVSDQKRGKLFSKISKIISLAARNGSDPATNPSLRVAIDNAKSASMPKENIERAIKKGSGSADGKNYQEIIYEAIAPGKIAILVECLTDNTNRALSELKAVLNKYNASLVSAGSVSYLFNKEGEIVIDLNKNDKPIEDIEELIIESKANDYEKKDSEIIVTTDFRDLHHVQKMLSDARINIESAELTYNAQNYIIVGDGEMNKYISLFDALEDLDDVNKIYSNIDFSD